jgi:dCMP deaminase
MKTPLETILMRFALNLRERSVDLRLKVGCVITDDSMTQVLGFGWNGGARGQADEPESSEAGKSNLIHAEINALIKTDYKIQNKIVFITHAPCRVCAKVLVNANISKLYYIWDYRDTSALDILKKAGIVVQKVELDGL